MATPISGTLCQQGATPLPRLRGTDQGSTPSPFHPPAAREYPAAVKRVAP